MSAAEQLSLEPRRKAKKSPVEDMCKCGHDVRAHTEKGRGCFVCKLQCKRFRTRSRRPPELPKGLAQPAGALDVVRQDLKKPKWCGWVLATNDPALGDRRLLAYLDHLDTKSPNVYRKIADSATFGRISKARAGALMAGLANEEKAQRERAMLALETAHVETWGMPRKIIITRISRGHLDHDNLVGALKHVRDGVAEGLLLEGDEIFDDEALDFSCDQAPPGKEGVYGVRIEIFW